MKKFLFAGLIMVLALTGCAKDEGLTQRIDNLEEEVENIKREVNNIKSDLEEATLEEELTLYFLETTDTDFYLRAEKRSVPKDDLTPTRAIEELIQGPTAGSDLKPVLPEGTQLLGLEVKNGTAEVNFNNAFMRNMNVGSQLEDVILSAVVNTLTEFPEIEQVQFLIEGEVVESIGGHIETSKPLARNEGVIKK